MLILMPRTLMHRTFSALIVLCAGAAAQAETFLVLPFFNLSKTSNIEWIGESLSESIREALGSTGLATIEREERQEMYRKLSMRPYTQLTTASVIKLADGLQADQVIYGSYELLPAASAAAKTRGTLRITARILDHRRLRRGPEYREIGALEDLTRLQTHLAWQTLKLVASGTAPGEEDFRRSMPPVRVEAIESYIRGLMAVAADQKMKLFLQATRLDPKFSQAQFQLGRLQWKRKSYRDAAGAFARVLPSDLHYREANFYLGLARYRLGDFAGAEQAFQLVASMKPLKEVLNNLGAAQSRRNSEAALENFRKALAGDPSDPDYHFNVGYALFLRGQYGEAAERFRAVLDRAPDDSEAITMLGRCLQKNKPSPRGSPAPSERLERLKETYEERR